MPGWTVDNLREHVDLLDVQRDRRYEQRFIDIQKAIEAALSASEKAINKAEVAANTRFEGVNEFRGQLTDQAATFITRVEAEAQVLRLNEQVQELKDRINTNTGRSIGVTATWAIVVTLIGVGVAVITVVITIRP